MTNKPVEFLKTKVRELLREIHACGFQLEAVFYANGQPIQAISLHTDSFESDWPDLVLNEDADARDDCETVVLTLEVKFDKSSTDADSVATALDHLLGTALSTPGVLDECGGLVVGEFEITGSTDATTEDDRE